MNTTPLTLPTVHLNGTGGDTLLAEYDHAADKFGEFVAAWCAITHHPRDYYVQGEGAFLAAQAERREIAALLCRVEEYLDAHRIHLLHSA